MADIEALTRQFISAYEQKDMDAIAGMFSADVILRDWNTEVAGYEAAIQEYTNNFQAADTLEIKIHNLLVHGLTAAAVLEIVVDGVETLRVVDLLSFSADGKIQSIVAYKGL